ncbi:MAG: glycosyltransferase family 39 protein [Candidatus Eisenbacteria bacterium]
MRRKPGPARMDAPSPQGPPRPTSPAEPLALLVIAVLLLAGITWGMHPQWSWDVDNTAPGSVLKALAQKFGPHWSSSYGPVPYLVMAAPMLPLLVAFKSSGELGQPSAAYPWGFAHPEWSVQALTLAARGTTLLAALLIVWMAMREARRAGSPRAWLAALLLAGSATFVYYARTTNVDVHYLFWLWAAFHLAEHGRRLRTLAAAGACAAFAVCTKEQAAPFALVATLVAMRRAPRLAPNAGARAALLPPLAAVCAYALVWRLPWGLPGWREHLRFVFEDARYERTFAATPAGFAQLGLRTLELLPLALGWAAVMALVTALTRRLPWRGLEARAIACALYLLAFVAPVGYVYPRFLLPLLLFVVPLGTRAFAVLCEGNRRGLIAAYALIACTGGFALTCTQAFDTRLAVERWLAPRLAAGAQVEIAGNPHFQARVPADRLRIARPDSLAAAPRAPLGDIVLASSTDEAFLTHVPAVAAAFTAPLQDSSRWTKRVFEPPFTARYVLGLPVAPRITSYERRR